MPNPWITFPSPAKTMSAALSTITYGAYAADLLQRTVTANVAAVRNWRTAFVPAALPVFDEF